MTGRPRAGVHELLCIQMPEHPPQPSVLFEICSGAGRLAQGCVLASRPRSFRAVNPSSAIRSRASWSAACSMGLSRPKDGPGDNSGESLHRSMLFRGAERPVAPTPKTPSGVPSVASSSNSRRMDVGATGDKHLRQTPSDVQIPRLFDHADVSCAEPPAPEGIGRRQWVVQVAVKHCWPRDANLTVLRGASSVPVSLWMLISLLLAAGRQPE